MNRYIKQLIEEFKQSADSVAGLMEGKRHPRCISKFEADVDSAKYVLLGEYLNINPIQFPPSEQLEEIELENVSQAFMQLLNAYGFLVSFPIELSSSMKYNLLKELLKKEVPILMHHYWRIPACDLEVETCPFSAEHCTCF